MGHLLGGILSRRTFLTRAASAFPAAWAVALPPGPSRPGMDSSRARLPGDPEDGPFPSTHPRHAEPLFRISLAEWSLHRTLRAGKMENLDFPRVAREEFGIEGVEYVNTFFEDRGRDRRYLSDLRDRCAGHGVRSLIIMCDGEGALGDPDPGARIEAVENHRKWLEAARFLGCHAIRVNAQSAGTAEEQRALAADGLRRLVELADPLGIDVIVENHGGLSSDGAWLAGVMTTVDHPRCGTLPDFGNFQTAPGEWYDRYRGVAELMPFARAVSAKSRVFDDEGNEAETDFFRMMEIVLAAGYRGWIGIEYEGTELSEGDGIRATKHLLQRVRGKLEEEWMARGGRRELPGSQTEPGSGADGVEDA